MTAAALLAACSSSSSNDTRLGGGAASDASVACGGEGEACCAGVAFDATHVYWVDYNGGMVLEAPLAGGNVVTPPKSPLSTAIITI